MKIIASLTYYYPHWTGLTAYAKRIAEGLVARGHEVTVLTTQHSDDLALDEYHNGVRIVRVKPVARLSRGVISPDFPAVAHRLIRESDVAQIHTPLLESSLIAGLCRYHDVPLLFTHHGDLVMPEGGFNQTVERIMVAQMTAALGLSSRITTHSQDYGENSDFLWPFANKLRFIYPPAEIPEPQPEVVAAWRAELGLTDKKLVGFAGRFVEEKGFDYLLQAIPLVIEQMPEAHFIYAGEHKVVYEDFYGKCKPLIDRYAEHITFVGLILDPQKLANFYAMADVFALPSRTDCFPSVQIEALLCGTPLVTASIPGAREVVRVTGMGLLVEPHNPQTLADGLVKLLPDPAAYCKPQSAIRSIFSMERTIDEYEALMHEMVGLPAPTPHAQPALVHLYAEPTPSLPVVRFPSRPAAQPLDSQGDPAERRRNAQLIEWLDLGVGDRVLSCGSGAEALRAQPGVQVVELAASRAGREHSAHHALGGAAEALPFADASFDAILVTDVLEQADDDRVALRELGRVLRPGGVLAIGVAHRNFPLWWDPINRLWTLVGGEPLRSAAFGVWAGRRRLYRPRELMQRVAAAGLCIEAVAETTHYAVPLTPYLVRATGRRGPVQKLLGGLMHGVDRLNDRPAVAGKTGFVNVLLKARRGTQQ
ncbi:MAG: glycosyltransferase [Herpetosiphonaceae bacterium]|nr:glycosyltransferase [Herpetosiphonaceae bacterium]